MRDFNLAMEGLSDSISAMKRGFCLVFLTRQREVGRG